MDFHLHGTKRLWKLATYYILIYRFVSVYKKNSSLFILLPTGRKTPGIKPPLKLKNSFFCIDLSDFNQLGKHIRIFSVISLLLILRFIDIQKHICYLVPWNILTFAFIPTGHENFYWHGHATWYLLLCKVLLDRQTDFWVTCVFDPY